MSGRRRHERARRGRVTAEVARRLLLEPPCVEEGLCYGTPGFRVRRKFLARLRDSDELLVVKCGFDERHFRMQADPDTFFTTDLYQGYPTVLARLSSVSADELHDLVEHAWRLIAPKRLVIQCEEAMARGAGPHSVAVEDIR